MTGAPPGPDRAPAWHALPAAAVLEAWRTHEAGLTSAEALVRRDRHGRNLITRAARQGAAALVWRQLRSPLVLMLVAAGLVAIAMGKLTDGLVVLAVVGLNTLIGFVQEFRAARAIEALLELVPEAALVVRDGTRQTVAVAELVPGDLVLLAAGDRVPADARLRSAKGLRVDEATLTGESVPAEKSAEPVEESAALGDRRSMVYGGTLVTYGTAEAVVVATGDASELGRISGMLGRVSEVETPLTRALARLGRQITAAIAALAVLMLSVGVWRASAAGAALATAVRDATLFAIALAVGAIPEGLPAILTIALAAGVQRMAARRAVIRKLPAAETLGSTTVIGSDKTGTLTRNEMTVQEVWTDGEPVEVTGVGYRPLGGFRVDGVERHEAPAPVRQLLLDAVLCSDATLQANGERPKVTGDPTEVALVVAARKAGIDDTEARRAHPRLDVLPFESENQFMASLHRGSAGDTRLLLKGAPEVVWRRCATAPGGGPLDSAALAAELDRLAAKGMRVLAVAEKPCPAGALSPETLAGGFRFAGLLGLIDPPRPEATAALRQCRAAGITVKMITGDHPATARAIGNELGLLDGGHGTLTGRELAALDDEQLRAAARANNVFARVAPEHKLRLVRALQGDGQVVAMTGDGVNDAPALKQADVGVAMGITGTAASREAADMVLTDDNFASIVAAVEEGRRVWDNLVKSLAFVLPTNLGLALILVYAVLFLPFDPLTQELLLPVRPVQILWVNLVATVTLALPLAFERAEPDVMRRPPRRRDEPVLGGFVVRRTVVAATLMAAGAIGLFQWEFGRYLAAGSGSERALREAQTMAVTTVVLFQAFYMLSCRSLRTSVFRLGLFSNRTVLPGLLVLGVLQAALVWTATLNRLFGTLPLEARDVALSALFAAPILVVVAVEKSLGHRGA